MGVSEPEGGEGDTSHRSALNFMGHAIRAHADCPPSLAQS